MDIVLSRSQSTLFDLDKAVRDVVQATNAYNGTNIDHLKEMLQLANQIKSDLGLSNELFQSIQRWYFSGGTEGVDPRTLVEA